MSRVDVTLGIRNAKFQTGVEKSKKKVKELKSVAAGGFNLGKVAGTSALFATLSMVAQKYDRIGKLTKRFNLDNTQVLQGLGFVAEQNGASLETLAKGLQQGNRAAAEAAAGNKTYADSFKRLGLDAEEFLALDQEAQFYAIADAISTAQNRNQSLADAQNLLGKSAGELMPMLEQGSESIREMADSVQKLSDVDVSNLELFNDNINTLRTDTLAWVGIILSKAIPAIKSLGATSAGTFAGLEKIWFGLGRVKDRVLDGDIKGAIERATKIPGEAIGAGLRTTGQGLEEVWKKAGRESGNAYHEGLEESLQNREAGFLDFSEMNRRYIEETANLGKKIADAQAEYNAEIEKTLELQRTEEEQLAVIRKKLDEAFRREYELGAEGDQTGSFRAAAEAERLKREAYELETALKEAATTAGENAARELRESLLERLEEDAAAIQRELAGTTQRKAGFRSEVDSLTKVGVGLSGVNNSNPSEFRRLEQLEKEQIGELKELRREVRDLRERPLLIESDEF